MKIITVLGTRPEIIRLSEIVKLFDNVFDHKLVHTGQNYDYELNQVFFDDLGIRKPDYFLSAVGGSVAETIGNILREVDDVLRNEQPDAFVVLGDTNSCLAAYVAKRRHVPVFHLEAGNRCFDNRVPEELNRKVIDHMSDVNLTYSHEALNNLLREGLLPDRNFVVGSPLCEVFNVQRKKITDTKILPSLGLEEGQYFLASLHREENVDNVKSLSLLISSLASLGSEYDIPVIMSAHPRTKKKLKEFNIDVPEIIKIHSPFGFVDYNSLQLHARCVLSDSGSVNEEASILGFRAVNVRDSHERPEASVSGITPMSGLDYLHMSECVKVVLAKKITPIIPDGYDVPDVSWRTVNHILSLTEYVRRKNGWNI